MGEIYSIVGGLDPNKIMEETWGHLNPKHDTTYSGTVDVACNDAGDYLITDWKLINKDGECISDSPEWYEHSNDFACEATTGKEAGFYRLFVDYKRKRPHGYHVRINHREKIG